jgi:hypothetical protein
MVIKKTDPGIVVKTFGRLQCFFPIVAVKNVDPDDSYADSDIWKSP